MLNEFEIKILLMIQEHLRCTFLNPIMCFITKLGDAGWFWIVSALLLVIFKKTRKIGITALLSLATCALITNVVLKNIVARTRPYDINPLLVTLVKHPHDFSFPSGHTTASFGCSLIYYRMLDKKYGYLAIALAILIAFSRLYIGVHYPTDILGGIVVGMVGSYLAYHYILKKEKQVNEQYTS